MVAVETALNRQVEMRVADERPLFGVLAHAYQPPRRFSVEMVLDGEPYSAGFSVAPEENDKITEQTYRPLLAEVESLQPGLITSIYAPLRSYFKKEQPELFKKIQETVAHTADKEYSVLGDTLIHAILPLLPIDDQRMLLSAGKQAFVNDFGFEPKGLWLPETGVTQETLKLATEEGYEFVPLRDSQVTNVPDGIQLDARHNICVVDVGGGKEMAVLLGNSDLSQKVSYQAWMTGNADEYMRGRRREYELYGTNPLAISDFELYGHHRPDVDKFLKRELDSDVLNSEDIQFAPLAMRQVLADIRAGARAKTYVDVRKNSSWSCEHGLGRWTGDCDCGEASERARNDKRYLYYSLQGMNEWVNASLDATEPGWRQLYADFLVANYDDIFTGVNFAPALAQMFAGYPQAQELTKYFVAKTEVMVGMTSCGWFFGKDDSIERAIPANMIQGVLRLFPGVFQQS